MTDKLIVRPAGSNINVEEIHQADFVMVGDRVLKNRWGRVGDVGPIKSPRDSTRFTFSIGVLFVLGTRQEFDVKDWVSAEGFEVDTLCTNAPCTNFVMLEEVRSDNVSILCDEIGLDRDGWSDAFKHSASVGEGSKIEPAVRMARGGFMRGEYSGFVPDLPGYEAGVKFRFCVSYVGRVRAALAASERDVLLALERAARQLGKSATHDIDKALQALDELRGQ